MTEQTEGADAEQSRVTSQRARELLDSTSDSVRAELERAEGWLRTAGIAGEPDYWHVDAVAGTLGALANVWGRLTMWSRGNGSYARLSSELDHVMDELTRLRSELLRSHLGEEETRGLQKVLSELSRIHEDVRRTETALN